MNGFFRNPEKPDGYAIVDSEGNFAGFKEDPSGAYSLDVSSIPAEMLDESTAKLWLERIMKDEARYRDALHFPLRIISLWERHIMTAKGAV